MQMKRKHLPPSKNHGDVMFRLAVRLRLRLEGAFPTCVSTPFRILSKQSVTTGRPEPKRKRNPAPTKPYVAPLSKAAAAIVASFSNDSSSFTTVIHAHAAPVSREPAPAALAATSWPASAVSLAARRPRRAAAIAAAERVAKRARECDESHDEYDDDDEAAGTSSAVSPSGAGDSGTENAAAREARIVAAAAASIPRPSSTSHTAFRFGCDDEEDDDDEDVAGVVLPSPHQVTARCVSHGSSHTFCSTETPGSEAVSVEEAEWARETAFGDAAVRGAAPASSAAAAFAAGMAASALHWPVHHRCRIMSDAAVLAAATSGRLDSFGADDVSHPPSASPLPRTGAFPSAAESPVFDSPLMLIDALTLGGGVVFPAPAAAFASSLRAAIVPIAPHSTLHPSLC